MAKIYRTVDGNWEPSGDTEGLWVYNGLDCCITSEVFEAIEPQLNENTRRTYEYSKALQAPILEMMARGVLVDQVSRSQLIAELSASAEIVKASLQEILAEGVGYPLEWNKVPSPKQLKALFYEVMGIPPVKNKKGITTDRKALEKIRGYFFAEPIVNHILTIRDLGKQISFLKTGIDSDGRIRTSFNIAGTDTGRLASYESAFGSGTNLQNVSPKLRKIYVADEGMRLCYVDLEQAEARAVGAILWNLFHDGKYLDFCESGDLHTNVCKMTWPYLGWTDDPSYNKKLAKQPFYRDFDYRDAAKRLGHGTNYFGQPPHMAREVHIPLPLVQEFQRSYLQAFPAISEWHAWVKAKLLRDGWITTFMGRHRWFMGRRWESETVRSAIAFEPQSAIADYLNRGMLDVWRSGRVQLLLQVHDAIVFQYPEHLESEIVPFVQRTLEMEVPLLHGRSLKIPTEAFVGWNWAYAYNNKKELVNPDGLVPFTGNDTRQRSKKLSLLDRGFFGL